MPTQFPPTLVVCETKDKGRGVFTAHAIGKGQVILRDPVALIEFEALRDDSTFNDYPMAWSETHNAIAFGLCNLLNHSDEPNVECLPDSSNMTMTCRTLRSIRAGEELMKKYGCGAWW